MIGPSAELRTELHRCGQDHLLEGIGDLDAETREAYLRRLAEIDWEELGDWFTPPAIDDLARSRVVDLDERAGRAAELRPVGQRCYAAGRVAVLMVAGGMGTRLGFDGPKGCYPAGAVSGKSIYSIQAEKVLSLSRRLGRPVPFLVMTSPATDAVTRRFFTEADRFGLDPDQLRFFSQGTVPSLDSEGRALLAGPGRLLENPDGHGGCFQALVASGELDRLRAEGIEQLVYVQVDNLNAPVDDPVLVGLANQEEAEVVTKVLEKAHPDEKLGHLVRLHGRDTIIEYVDLDQEQVRMTDVSGEPIFRWGSPAMFCWRVTFLSRLADRGLRLPLHRSAKPLQAWREGGHHEVQGWKCERFIFDLLPLADRSLGLEIEREAEFAPIKNAEGADSVESARRLHSDLACRWLAAVGVEVDLPAGAHVEVSPLFAATEEQFRGRWDGRVSRVDGDLYIA